MSGSKLTLATVLAVSAVAASAWVSQSAWTAKPAAKPAAPAQTVAKATPQAALATGSRVVRMSEDFARDMKLLASTEPYGAIVHFDLGTVAEHRALMTALNLKVGYDFEQNASALYVIGPVASFKLLMSNPLVRYLEANSPMRYYDDTDGWATRVRVAQEPVSTGPYYDATGNILRGQGVGIAVVDSGFNGIHPDFADNMAHNYRVNCPVPTADEANLALCQFTDFGTMASTEVAGGHGTHCAGIALGGGQASTGIYPVEGAKPNVAGTYTGVAPDAKLYGFGAGAATQILLLNAAAGFDKIIKDNASGANNPKVRVISNSYGGDGAYNPDAVVSKLTNRAIDEGISVVFAAGNDGADFTADAADPSLTGASCRNPKPGLICVASYNDNGTGARDADLSGFSSRAEPSRLSEYPDIAAPGDLITSVCTQGDPGQTICATGAETHWQPYYGTISGTSMATPHVAGIIALMYQARPELTPAQVEKIIKDNALKLGSNGAYVDDPSNPGGTTNFGFGAGLIDVPSILNALGVMHAAALPAAGSYTVADGDTDTSVAGAADIIKVELLEESEGGQNGIRYSLTLRDATAFGTPAASQVRLMVANNVDGNPFNSGVVLKPDGSVAPVPQGPTASAAASSARKTDNVVSFFVPLGALGGPAVGMPIHNIVASSLLTNASGESVADYAPSSSAVATLAGLQPTYGKPYTVLTASAPVVENICEAPGAVILTDGSGDIITPTGVSTLQSYDISSLRIAQPYYENGDYKLVLTLKMTSLTPLPQATTWPINFCSPGSLPCTGASAYSATNRFFTVRMTNDPSVRVNPAGTAPEFQILQPTADGTTAASRTVKLADAASTFDADGTITFVVNASDIGLTPATAGSPAQSLSLFLSRISNSSGTTPDNMPDAATQGAGLYATRPLPFCAPNALPLAVIAADPKTAPRGTTVRFSAFGSSDPDAGDTLVSYVFNFGDGSPAETLATAEVSHVYAQSGVYSASLSVTDSKGASSVGTAASAIGITVTDPAPAPPAPAPPQTPPSTAQPQTIVGPSATAVEGGRYGGALGLPLLAGLLLLGRRRRH